MTDLAVVDRSVDPFDTVELDPDGRINYTDGHLTALYPEGSDTGDYRVALFHYQGERATVELPDGSVALSVSSGTVTALVPTEAYAEGSDR